MTPFFCFCFLLSPPSVSLNLQKKIEKQKKKLSLSLSFQSSPEPRLLRRLQVRRAHLVQLRGHDKVVLRQALERRRLERHLDGLDPRHRRRIGLGQRVPFRVGERRGPRGQLLPGGRVPHVPRPHQQHVRLLRLRVVLQPPPGDLVAQLDAVGARQPQRRALGRARAVLEPDELGQALGPADDVGGVPVAEDLVREVGLELSGLGVAGAEVSLREFFFFFCRGFFFFFSRDERVRACERERYAVG